MPTSPRRRSARCLAISLLGAAACAYTPEPPLLDQHWASTERLRVRVGNEILEDELKARWKERRGDGWGVREVSLRAISTAPKGSKVVVLVPKGTHAITEPIEVEGIDLEVIGEGCEESRVLLDADARGFVLRDGRLLVRGVTLSCFSSEGLTVLGGEAELDASVFNGSRHGLYIARGSAKISGCYFLGNESGVDMGAEARIHVRDSVFAKNWDAITGERPASLTMTRCLVLGSVHAALAFRFGPRVRLSENIFAENRAMGWQGVVEAAQLQSNLLGDDAFSIRGLRRRGNRPISRIASFPASLPEGLPKKLSLTQHMLQVMRLRMLGSGKVEDRVRQFAEDEALQCLIRSEELASMRELRKATVLFGVAEGYLEPYPKLEASYHERLEALRSVLGRGPVEKAPLAPSSSRDEVQKS